MARYVCVKETATCQSVHGAAGLCRRCALYPRKVIGRLDKMAPPDKGLLPNNLSPKMKQRSVTMAPPASKSLKSSATSVTPGGDLRALNTLRSSSYRSSKSAVPATDALQRLSTKLQQLTPVEGDGDEEEAEAPEHLRALVRSSTQALEQITNTMAATDEPYSPNSTPAQRREEFPEYAGTKKEKASSAEKEDLAIARLCRNHWRIKQREAANHLKVKPPQHPYSATHLMTNKSLLGAKPQEVHRPPHMYLSDVIYCPCTNCRDKRDLELKADRYWLAGNWDKALSIVIKSCEMVLSDLRTDIALRPRRRAVFKDIDWVSPLQKAIMTVTFNEVFEIEIPKTHRTTLHRKQTMDDVWLEYEAEIKRVESVIRRSIGSGDWCAEVVVVVCSLQVSWKAYFQSYRILRFLEAKGVEHFAIDINSDIGSDTLDYNVIRLWVKENLLHQDPTKTDVSGHALNCYVPQIIVDGVPVGTFEEVMTMEDEGDLDYILAREACPNCLYDRHPDAGHCGVCGAVFHDLISTKYLPPEAIKVLLKRNEINAARIKAPTPRDFERRRRQLGFARLGEDLTTWLDPEKMKLFGAPSVGFIVDFDEEEEVEAA
eukprot:Blabericola_migrator_1__121@NODE_102_length_14292_cov_312_776380_g90_i0_p3_GENE_NODE_102_length_14292_cov_312_776380_g90_i0NODE_102_length_14292_cov_312_776380_g90_i0_p3_ORF_typecomplete_len600_score85_18SH3BGR/PF04908_15/0_0012FUSC/PF04632_12/0_12DZR/PF12773_7/8_1e03DZR/PF12773_7/3_3e03DZR/PF12773_7/0_11SMC_ScpA/PF02616_14/1_NODE_102_length_14292_cov_312_776380_g90_i01154813347